MTPPEEEQSRRSAAEGAVPTGDAPAAPDAQSAAREPRDAPPRDAPPRDAPPRDAPPRDAPPRDAPPRDASPRDAPPSDAPAALPPANGSSPLLAVRRRLGALPPAVVILLLVAGPATLTSVVLAALALSRRAPPPSLDPAAPAAVQVTVEAAAPVEAGAPDDPDASSPRAPDGAGDAFRVRSLEKEPSLLVKEVPVGRRAFVTAMAQAGVSVADTHRLLAAFRPLRSFDRCGAQDSFVIAKERKGGRLVAFEYTASPFDIWQARREGDTRFDAKKLELAVERRPVAVAFSVDGELRASLQHAGLDEGMLAMLDDALSGHVELSSVRPGSRLRLLASEDRVEGRFSRYAELEALEYVPADPRGTPLRVYHFGGPVPEHRAGKPRPGGFYDARGRQPFSGGYRSPVPLARISSRFNPRRVHPVLHVVMPHMGVDFAAPPGTPVYATAAGVVRSVGDGGPCGNMVQVLHGSGLVSAYCHLSRYAAGLRPGQRVEGRQLVGYVGQTGRATGPHLHFAIKRGDAFIDPMSLRLDGFRVVPPADREAFDVRRGELDARLDAVPLPAGASPPDGGGEAPSEDEINDEPP